MNARLYSDVKCCDVVCGQEKDITIILENAKEYCERLVSNVKVSRPSLSYRRGGHWILRLISPRSDFAGQHLLRRYTASVIASRVCSRLTIHINKIAFHVVARLKTFSRLDSPCSGFVSTSATPMENRGLPAATATICAAEVSRVCLVFLLHAIAYRS